MKKKVLVIAGHLDDSIIAVGGILRLFVNAGHDVTVVCFGNGDEAFTKPDEREASKQKFMHEAREAHAILGVQHFECYDVPDFGVEKNRENYRTCIRAIRTYQPDIVFGHYWMEYFQHHAAATLARDAWFQSGWNCSADLGKPWQADKFFHYEVLQDLPEPTHLVDISAVFDMKIKAWKKFETAEEHLGSLTQQLTARARYLGSKIGTEYAEALKQSFFTPRKITEAQSLFS